MKKPEKVIPYKEQRHINFIALIFAVILIYLVVQIIRMFTGKEYTVYELKKEEVYSAASVRRGLILRDEITYPVMFAGRINYLTAEGSKVSVKTPVYTTKDLSFFSNGAAGSVDVASLSKAALSSVKNKLVDSAVRGQKDFFLYYLDKADIQASVKSTFLQGSGLNLESLVNDGSIVETTDRSGYILYRSDSLDSVSEAGLTKECFQEESLQIDVYPTGREARVGQFAYKIVPDDTFSIAFLMDEKDQVRYAGKSYLSVNLTRLKVTQNAAFHIDTLPDGSKAGILTFSKYGSSYLTERFLDFILEEERVEGYRIPVTSVLTRDFLLVPSAYIMKSAGEGTKVFKEYTDASGRTNVTAVGVSLYAVSGDMVYISSTKLERGDYLVLPKEAQVKRRENGETVTVSVFEPDLSGRFHLSLTAPLTGVYNVNKGYCIFRQVEILEKTRDGFYYLINTKTAYGLSAYDRIMQDASGVTDNQIVFQ